MKYSYSDSPECYEYPLASPMRVDILLHTLLQDRGCSRERSKKYILQGYIYLNNTLCTSPSKKVHDADTLSISIPEEQSMLHPEEGDLDIHYEDTDFLLINKPASLVVHPCVSTPHGTLLQRLLFHYPELTAMGGERPAIVHRLDKDTTGLLLIARNEQTRLHFITAFSERTIHKAYLAFVQGISPEQGKIQQPIGRDASYKTRMAITPHGKEAYTEYTRLALFPPGILPYPVSLLSLRILTGRTHQIRVHCASIGHPLLGDTLYGALPSPYIKRPLLHAIYLSFMHPSRKTPMDFFLPPPTDFETTFELLTHKSLRIILTGSAGSGKSTALSYYKKQGIPCCSADEIINTLYQQGNALWHYMKQSYGEAFFTPDGHIDKKKILNLMNSSPSYKKEIERITHSFLLHALQDFWKEHQERPFTIIEVPLYFESELFRTECPADIIIAVLSEEENRIQRMRDKGWSEDKIAYVRTHQYPDSYKKEHSQYCIYNDTSAEELYKQCEHSLIVIESYILQEKDTKKKEFSQYLEQASALLRTSHQE